jgi:hypothetical protein
VLPVTDTMRDRHPGGSWAPHWRTALVFVVAAGAGTLTRVWQIAGRDAIWWNDSADFLTSARTGLLSADRWAGPRTPASPLVLSLAGLEPGTYVTWQAAIAVVCWAALAASVWTVVAGRWSRWLAAGVVVAFSSTVPVTMWERSVLSESLAASTLALLAAATLQLARGVDGWRVAGVLVAAALWLATRDTHASVALVAASALAAGLVVAEWRRRHRREADDRDDPADPDDPADRDDRDDADDRDRRGGRPADALVVLACGLFLLGAAATAGASHGNRHAFPLRNVFEVRVLPYPDRVAWFADRGMPQAGLFAGPDALVPVVDGDQAPVTYVGDNDPALQEWLAWLERDGRQAFALWVVTHPAYLVTEPLRDPERTFNNARGDRSFYAPLDQREVPLVTTVLFPARIVALSVAVFVAMRATSRRRWSDPLVLTGAVVVALAAPHALVSWHSDGMETARHLVVPVLQLHLGVLLMVIGAAGWARGRAP